MTRGEVWWADLEAPAGRRPVVLLSRATSYDTRDAVIVSPITTRARGLPTEVTLNEKDGLPKACVVNLDTVQTILKSRLRDQVTTLSRAKLQAVDAALRYALDL